MDRTVAIGVVLFTGKVILACLSIPLLSIMLQVGAPVFSGGLRTVIWLTVLLKTTPLRDTAVLFM